MNLILDLCGLLAGKALPSGDVDEDEGGDLTNDPQEKGKGKKPAKNKKRKDKKSVLEIEDNPGGEGQLRDPNKFLKL